MTRADPAIWCGIPVYNNSATIAEVARGCRELVEHVVVVDDGSTDADLTELLKPLDVTVIRHPRNQGKGRALLTAFGHAAERGAQYLITLDGDGQHFPADLPRFFPKLSPATILIGERDQITGEMPRSSRFGRKFSDFWIRLEAGGNARDTQSGFRAYPLAAVMQLKLDSQFYNFEMEIITKALWAGLCVENVPIRVWYPPRSQRVSSFDPLRDNLRISLLHTRLVLRQLLPVPHRKITTAIATVAPLAKAGPIALAVSAALGIVMGIVLWPLGIFAVLYVTIRLHLNKMIALACAAVCTLPMVPRVCERFGRTVFKSGAHPQLLWLAGSHLVALPLAVAAGWIVYAIASRVSQDQT